MQQKLHGHQDKVQQEYKFVYAGKHLFIGKTAGNMQGVIGTFQGGLQIFRIVVHRRESKA